MRRPGVALLLAAALMTAALPASAHGLGGRADLPIPLGMFLAGAAVVLILSFAALAVVWPRPRWQQGATLRAFDLPGFTGALSALRISEFSIATDLHCQSPHAALESYQQTWILSVSGCRT